MLTFERTFKKVTVKRNGIERTEFEFGFAGDTLETGVKFTLNRPNAEFVSGQGKADFTYKTKRYEIKQNGSCIKYARQNGYIRGSRRVIYAPHIEYDVVDESDESVTISLNLADTPLYVVDRDEFVEYLLDNGFAKFNRKRGEVNIQTLWNYTRNAPLGAKERKLTAWLRDHEIEDNIVDDILEAWYE